MATRTPREDEAVREQVAKIRPTRGGHRPGDKLVSDLKAPPVPSRRQREGPQARVRVGPGRIRVPDTVETVVPKGGILDETETPLLGEVERDEVSSSEPTIIDLSEGDREEIRFRELAEYIGSSASSSTKTPELSAMFYLGKMSEKIGNLKTAEEWYRRAANSGSIDAIVELGRLLEAKGDTESAEEQYRRAVELGSREQGER